jgi:hypothetical protein
MTEGNRTAIQSRIKQRQELKPLEELTVDDIIGAPLSKRVSDVLDGALNGLIDEGFPQETILMMLMERSVIFGVDCQIPDDVVSTAMHLTAETVKTYRRNALDQGLIEPY